MDPTEEASAVVIDGTEILPESTCDRLLDGGGVGILAMPGAGAPVLRPVNYLRRGDWLLVRTGEGQILEAAKRSEPASFVVARVDRFEHAGWSVVVSGRLSERPELGTDELRPWARAHKDHIVGLSVDEISGRRIADGPMEREEGE